MFGPNVSVVEWDRKSSGVWQDYANGAYAVVNLAGENIGSGRWSLQKKQAILKLNSRSKRF
jgi:NAD dependent epimerase/dehydratase family enzyme